MEEEERLPFFFGEAEKIKRGLLKERKGLCVQLKADMNLSSLLSKHHAEHEIKLKIESSNLTNELIKAVIT